MNRVDLLATAKPRPWRIAVAVLLGICWPWAGFAFEEGWETAAVGSYSPAASFPLIPADAGTWILGDTVSNYPEDCGPTPHRADVLSSPSGKALQLTSVNTNSECSDNVFLSIFEIPAAGLNPGFSVPITEQSRISFNETGALVNPEIGFDGCIVPPCGDTVSILLQDNRGNILAYILQRDADRGISTPHPILEEIYAEILLDPAAGTYSRNVAQDFASVPNFNLSGAAITSVEFKIQDHGQARLDNLVIGVGSPIIDTDGDGVPDPVDNCPSFSNPSQADTDGNGRGNACECGDVNLDGRISVSDLVSINVCIFAPLPKPQACIDFCDCNNDGQCNVNDILACNIEIFSPGRTSTCARQPVPGP